MGVSRKQSTSNFPENEHFLPPDTNMYVCVSGSKKCSFFGKLDVLCFLETPVLRFALLPYYRRKKSENKNLFKYNFLNCLGLKWLSLPKIFLSASCVLYKSDVYFFDFVSCSIQIFPSANLFSINLLLLNLKLTSQV